MPRKKSSLSYMTKAAKNARIRRKKMAQSQTLKVCGVDLRDVVLNTYVFPPLKMEIIDSHLSNEMVVIKNEPIDNNEYVSLVDTKDNLLVSCNIKNENCDSIEDRKGNVLAADNVNNELVQVVETKDLFLNVSTIKDEHISLVDIEHNVLADENIKVEPYELVDNIDNELADVQVKNDSVVSFANRDNVLADGNVKIEQFALAESKDNVLADVEVKTEPDSYIDTEDNFLSYVYIKTEPAEKEDTCAASDNQTAVADDLVASTMNKELTMIQTLKAIKYEPGDNKLLRCTSYLVRAIPIETPHAPGFSSPRKKYEARNSCASEITSQDKLGVSKTGRIRCKHCSAYFTPEKLEMHKIMYNLDDRHLSHVSARSDSHYTCKICDKTFKGKFHYKLHTNIHTAGRLYCCDVCNDGFDAKSKLKAHMSMHPLFEAPHKCDVCGKIFTHIFSLFSHMNTH